MNTILWTQNEKPIIPDTLIIDGERSEFDGTKKQNTAVKVLSSVSDWTKIYQSDKSNLSIQYKNKEGFFISACFNETDIAGRPMAFTYFSNNVDLEDAVMEMKEDLKKLPNRSFNSEELDKTAIGIAIQKIESIKKKKIGIATTIGGVLMILSLSYLLLGGNDKGNNKDDGTDHPKQERTDTIKSK